MAYPYIKKYTPEKYASLLTTEALITINKQLLKATKSVNNITTFHMLEFVTNVGLGVNYAKYLGHETKGVSKDIPVDYDAVERNGQIKNLD